HARLAGGFTALWALLLGGWLGALLGAGDSLAPPALGLAAACALLAAAAVCARARLDGGESRWFGVLAPAWQGTAALGLVAALALAGLSWSSPLHAGSSALLAATALLLAWWHRSTLLSWAGSALLLAGLAQALVAGVVAGRVGDPWLVAFLSHATLTLL